MRIIGTHIEINRGDILEFDYDIDNFEEKYVFQSGDSLKFSIYGEEAMDKEPFVQKKFDATVGETSVHIVVSGEEMKIGEYINEPVDYWYEIELNGDRTVSGFDNNGAKILTLYPEGFDKK